MSPSRRLRVKFELELKTHSIAVSLFDSALEYDMFLNEWRDKGYAHFQLPMTAPNSDVKLITVAWKCFMGAEVTQHE